MFSQQLVQPAVLRCVMYLCIPFKLIKEKKVLCNVINHCREWPEVFPEENFLSVFFESETRQIEQKAFTLTAVSQRWVRRSVPGWLALLCIRKAKLWGRVLCSSAVQLSLCCPRLLLAWRDAAGTAVPAGCGGLESRCFGYETSPEQHCCATRMLAL